MMSEQYRQQFENHSQQLPHQSNYSQTKMMSNNLYQQPMNIQKQVHFQDNMSNHVQSPAQDIKSMSQRSIHQMNIQKEDPMNSFGMVNSNNEYNFNQNKMELQMNKNPVGYNINHSRNSFNQSNFKVTNSLGDPQK